MIRFIQVLIFTCACLISQAQVNIITTIAGKDTFGYSGDGGPATNAKLKAPYGICSDKSGNIYVADAFNNRIRYINITTAIITTIAGKGTPGYSGDGGLAIDAEFTVPQAVAIDANGNLYVCDGANHRIRKIVVSSGIISTIAGTGFPGNSGDGGLATNAELNQPGGVFVDNHENIYFADWGNNKVRRISQATGVITTIVGTGVGAHSGDGGLATAAQVYRPVDVSEDTSGNILVAEQYSHVIRRINSSGIITTIAGNGVAGYSGDDGPAINASLSKPTGLFVDKNNNIYVAEYNNGTIRKIDAVTGIITTVAGTGVTGFSGDGGPATNAKLFCSDVFVDNNGNLIIADYENNRIRKVSSGVLVNGIDKEIEGKLYPNPTKGAFTIQTPMNIAIVSIYNIAGMRVYEQTCTTPQTEVDITNQSPGIYIVYVQCGEKQYVSKIVKQ